jgi:hypothetical protein
MDEVTQSERKAMDSADFSDARSWQATWGNLGTVLLFVRTEMTASIHFGDAWAWKS